ncbi:MAG: hypothetical protein ACRD2J_15600 [Thermoanaerobaculia bacterium]
MSRLHRLSKDEVNEDVRELYRSIGQQRGNVPNLFRVHAHRPEILRAASAHLQAATSAGTVPPRLKELIATLVSKINSCHY